MFVPSQKVSKGLLQLTKLKLISWILFSQVYCCHPVTAEAAVLKQKKRVLHNSFPESLLMKMQKEQLNNKFAA